VPFVLRQEPDDRSPEQPWLALVGCKHCESPALHFQIAVYTRLLNARQSELKVPTDACSAPMALPALRTFTDVVDAFADSIASQNGALIKI